MIAPFVKCSLLANVRWIIFDASLSVLHPSSLVTASQRNLISAPTIPRVSFFSPEVTKTAPGLCWQCTMASWSCSSSMAPSAGSPAADPKSTTASGGRSGVVFFCCFFYFFPLNHTLLGSAGLLRLDKCEPLDLRSLWRSRGGAWSSRSTERPS